MDDSLSFESFFEGAKKAAQRAIDDHGRGEYDEFALHAGVAVERLAKAVLISKNPIYIAEIRNADMLLYLGGHLQMDEEKVRTVGAKDAIARLRKIRVLQTDPQLDLLIEMRNGAAHASTASSQAKGMISSLARTIETLLGDLDKPLDTFWERWTEPVKAAVDEREDQELRDMQLRITQARHRFDDRFTGLPKGVKERALREYPAHVQTAWGIAVPLRDDAPGLMAVADCPACSSLALTTLQATAQSDTTLVMSTDGLSCELCSLKLSGVEEVQACGVQSRWLPGTAVPASVAIESGTPPGQLDHDEAEEG
ncbi:hypothetical protein HEK616_36250 [Streptomyces nigrescens]|uniref:DUF4145 domain-containing protein n=1 Tax=Streptomyces nigrescens TaxID=1920 RepID=A0ABM7ZUT5_STRNI|nr:hypothetical protein [Streptomyces nigrescens]BDM70138.1 hypothetical protein HEK616_36250 [Streptomyces nigrescens]